MEDSSQPPSFMEKLGMKMVQYPSMILKVVMHHRLVVVALPFSPLLLFSAPWLLFVAHLFLVLLWVSPPTPNINCLICFCAHHCTNFSFFLNFDGLWKYWNIRFCRIFEIKLSHKTSLNSFRNEVEIYGCIRISNLIYAADGVWPLDDRIN